VVAQKRDDSETHKEVTAIAGKLSSATAICRLKKDGYLERFFSRETTVLRVFFESFRLCLGLWRFTYGYCWPTPKYRNWCAQHAFFEGKKVE
jgi:hypothetical protein